MQKYLLQILHNKTQKNETLLQMQPLGTPKTKKTMKKNINNKTRTKKKEKKETCFINKDKIVKIPTFESTKCKKRCNTS
jgi:hypothetical protein